VEELLEKWKNLNKALQTGKFYESDMSLNSAITFETEILAEVSRILNTKKEDIPLKVKKLYDEWSDAKTKLKDVENLFNEHFMESLIKSAFMFKNHKMIIKSFENITLKDLQNLSKRIHKKEDSIITLFVDKTKRGIGVLGMGSKNIVNDLNLNIGEFVKGVVEQFGGKGGGSLDYGQGLIDIMDTNLSDVINKIKEKLNI
jgi:alanyl-tRNA synthetase